MSGQADGPMPKLSLVYVARNDNYMGNFAWRFETALNYLADNLARLGRLDDVEAVITDWGSEISLHRALALTPRARRLVRFVIVPPAMARVEQRDSPFPIVIAQNAAIRRCRADYIAQTDSDVLFTPDILAFLLDALEGRRMVHVPLNRALVYAKRRHVPWQYASSNPPLHEVDWFMRHAGWLLPVETFVGFAYAGTGLMMMHRQLWEECRGYDERLIYWGWMEIDLGLRIQRRYPLYDLRRQGFVLFHLEHYPSRRASVNPRKLNPTEFNNAFRPNDEGWGLGNYTLEEYTCPHEALPEKVMAHQTPAVQLNARLVANILRALGKRLWQPMQSAFVIFYLLQRSKFHAGVVWRRVSGHPIGEWPHIVSEWWAERRRRI
jgi:hypothetical protein